MGWSIRKNAKQASSIVQYLSCVYSGAAATGSVVLNGSGSVYYELSALDQTMPTRISTSGGKITLNICEEGATEENVRIVIEKLSGGYKIQGTSSREAVKVRETFLDFQV